MTRYWKSMVVVSLLGVGLTGWALAADPVPEAPAVVEPLPEEGIWGAIAYSTPDSRYGFFWGADRRDEAAQEALQHCENDGGEACSVISEFRNHRHWDDDDQTGFPYWPCAALAVGDEGADTVRYWGTGSAMRRKDAEEIALQQCGGEANQCKIQEWVCT